VLINIDVIKNPDITKNRSTPKDPKLPSISIYFLDIAFSLTEELFILTFN
jgi:hypothetical protein